MMRLDEAMEFAKRLRKAQVGWAGIARATGRSVDEVRRRLDPDYREKRRIAERKRYRHKYEKAPMPHYQPYHINRADAERALASVPADTRSSTGRVFGDPLPGRSALDKRQTSVSLSIPHNKQ